jgi:acyl-[acyl-carrier-protein]-phospholipid O-acyltransferase/long-chain-fatty-acid--[acyl-carrier-protein] ligase
MRGLLRRLLRVLFRFSAHNEAVLSTPGPVLLIPNHVSWLDWLFIGVCLEDDWKFVVSSATAQATWLHRKIMLTRRSFPIDTTSPYAVKRMAEYLQTRGRLVLFAEGRISRTGGLMKLFDGTGFLLHKTQARVITAYVRGAHRIPTSPNPDRKSWYPRVSVHFSEVATPPHLEHLSTSHARSQLTAWLRDRMMRQQFEVETATGPSNVLEAVVSAARRSLGTVVLQDVTGSLSFRRFLTGVDIVADRLDARLGSKTERVGVLLPNINATPVVIHALWSLGRVPAVLNFSTGPQVMVACAQLAGLRQVVTSRAFLEKARLDTSSLAAAGIEFLFLEDLREGVGGTRRLSSLVRISLNPRSVIRRPQSGARAAFVLFTSGSEGVPKGVELTHANVMSNIRQMLSVCDFCDTDRVFNCLPLFHSFGLTIGTLLPLARGVYTFLYPSPLHYRVVPTVLYDRDCTVLLSTNTFLNGYARKANPYDFRSLRFLFAGAEKIQESTSITWMRRFGVRILEGYGATECSPCIAINTPTACSFGTVGRLLPGIEHRLEPVEGVTEGGRLLVRGPNVMRGYLNTEANAKFQALSGWYDTGDIVSVDDAGYVSIRGRLKRFAKVSGEMVSLTAVEEALAGAFPQFGLRCQIAVIAVADEDKGEKLIAVANESRLTLEEVRAAVRARGLSNLCAPRELRFLREIPKLGTGKVNHRELQTLIGS